MLNHFQDNESVTISAVISNKADAFGLQRAARAGVPTQVLSHRDYSDRLALDQALIQVIDQYQPDLVVLAGFMRILTPEFTQHYQQRLMNIHHSLLPKYKGLDTHQRALEAGDTEHGCSVHFVTEHLDGGPVIIQASIAIEADDNVDSLAQKIHQLEHQIYPLAVQWFAEGRLQLANNTVVLDGHVLSNTGYPFNPSS